MSISHSLTNALSGLTAASRMAEVVSSNLANALTDGYGRRMVELSAASAGGRGAGVRIDGILRVVDRGVLADRRLADATLSASTMRAQGLARLEGALGPAGSEMSIPGRVSALEQALAAAAADPSSDISLGRVVDRLGNLAAGLRGAAGAIQTDRLEADRRIAADVEMLNASLLALEEANKGIASALNAGQDATALMDERQRIVDRIGQIVPVRELDRSNGTIALVTTGGEVMIDGPARQYGFAGVNGMTADMTMGGALSGITRDGVPLDPLRGIGPLDGGSLGAAFRMRDDVLVKAQAGLDALAADLAGRLRDPAAPPASAGLLTDAAGPVDPGDVTGLAARISVNAVIDPAQGGALWRLRDGLVATTPGPVGMPGLLDTLGTALAATAPASPGGPSATAAGHAARLLAGIGADRLSAEEGQGFALARQTALREAEAANGVDSDHEMQMLLRIEQAYAANVRVIETLDSMIRTLMEI